MDATITKANSLIQASYKLSIQEARIILLAISKINPKQKITDKEFYTVTAKEYSELTGVKNSYKELKKVVDRLFDRKVTITHEPNSTKPLERPIKTRFIQAEVEYLEEESQISILFSTMILPYLSQLSKCFTTYKLKDIGQLDTFYSIRLYELFSQNISIGYRVITLEQLRNDLELNSKYESIKDLKKRVIEPSLTSINKKSNLSISYENIKKGRSIFAFRFEIKSSINNTSLPITDQDILDRARPGESWDEVKKRLKAESTLIDYT